MRDMKTRPLAPPLACAGLARAPAVLPCGSGGTGGAR